MSEVIRDQGIQIYPRISCPRSYQCQLNSDSESVSDLSSINTYAISISSFIFSTIIANTNWRTIWWFIFTLAKTTVVSDTATIFRKSRWIQWWYNFLLFACQRFGIIFGIGVTFAACLHYDSDME